MIFFRHWKTWASLLAVFVAGLLVGGFVTLRVVQRVVAERKNADNWAPQTMKWLENKVHVTSDQKATIEPIVQKSMGDLRQLRDDAASQTRMIFGLMFRELSNELSESQRQLLQQQAAKFRETHGVGQGSANSGVKP